MTAGIGRVQLGQWRTTEDMRRDQEELRARARALREHFDAAPAAFDVETMGRADTATVVNNALGGIFKQFANHAAELDAIADKIDPENGTFDGIPVTFDDTDDKGSDPL